jgi:AcrR family transcriptional regulator
MESKLIKHDLNYILFAEEYSRFKQPKAKRKAFILLEATIQCLARKGFGQVTLEMIAREAAVSRTLVKYYFKSLQEIELYALKYIRISAQKLAAGALEEIRDPQEMLCDYTKACLKWAHQYRTHALVWLSFVQRCGRDKSSRQLNSEAVAAGTQRIQSLLELGKTVGRFHCSDTAKAARMIQVIITGALCTIASENFADEKAFVDDIQSQCLAIAQEA